MTESDTEKPRAPRGGGDRRAGDRRRVERRAPPPPWRRPWALVGYGVLGALALVMLTRALGSDDESQAPVEVTRTVSPPPVAAGTPVGASAPVVDAHTIAAFEGLIARGQAAEGQRVRTVLFCDATRSIALMSVDEVNRSIANLADRERRVPGAECKWGQDRNAPDFLLLIPPEMTSTFAAAPVVRVGFVDRRRVAAEVEWLGRPDALALRTAGVLRRIGN